MDAATESPYGWPVELWKRRTELATNRPDDQVTTGIADALLPSAGVVADIGAGTGRASLPLARGGHRVIAIEKDAGMADGLGSLVRDPGLDVEIVIGAFPDVADLPRVDVAMAANVVYDVADIQPFLQGMHDMADGWVVLELTERHPWTEMGRYFRSIHDLDRPTGPTARDLVRVIDEVFGIEPRVREWSRPPGLYFENWDEVLAYYGKRLAVPDHRRRELTPLLEHDLVHRDGRWWAEEIRGFATVWWPTS